MKLLNTFLHVFSLSLCTDVFFQHSALAQIVPDQSLGNQNSVVTNTAPNVTTISGGASTGINLFHSFNQFNVPQGTAAYFLDPGVINIIGRVTGSDPSQIFGLVGVNGNANLFLLNPNGFIFGPNAKIDLNGAFIVSSGDEIEFSNGYSFNAVSPNEEPTLDVGQPTAISFSDNPGTIQILGNGHNLFQAGNIFTPVFGFDQNIQNGLTTRPGKQIAFLGGDILLNGAVINSPSGIIDIGAVSSGKIKLNSNNGIFSFDYSDVSNYRNIILSNQSLLNVSGLGFGNISLFGRNITLSDGSLIINSNFGTAPGGTISITATEDLIIKGLSDKNKPLPNGIIPRGIISQTFSGQGANIAISAQSFTLIESSGVISSTFGSGTGGNIALNTFSTEILGGSPFGEQNIGSLLLTTSAGSGAAGQINLKTNRLSIRDGGYLISAAFGSGTGGDVFIDAEDIELIGGITIPEKNTFNGSSIASTTISSGNAGNLNVSTKNLTIRDGARLNASTLAGGNAGDVNVTATNILLSGSGPNFLGIPNPSTIDSSAIQVGPFLAFIFGLPPTLTGNSGEVRITTTNLQLENGAEIAVRNEGSGNGGTIQIRSNLISLNNSSILSSTQGGDGGNVAINTDGLVLRNSQINSSARGNGNGGNTTIAAQVMAGDYTSFINAKADQGEGGDITINTNTLIFPQENISASSNRGVDFSGNIEVNARDYGPQQRKEEKLSDFKETETIACNPSSKQVSFTLTGDDVPAQKDDIAEVDTPIKEAPYYIENSTGQKKYIIEMQGWIPNKDGTATPIAYNRSAFGGSYLSQACKNLDKINAKK
jgi:filamentous hemagglutinin family protein